MFPRFFIRSTIFNLCFYTLTAIACILLLPTLFLPRKAFFTVVHGFVHTAAFLEKYILGLTYEIRGKEHLPSNTACIIAAKHQSAYETFKLHILFNDPAIVLKKELLKIPLWGQYLAKSDVIAIDRSSPKIAIKSIQDGARRVAAQGRQIVIFPQGTRVATEVSAQQKPYKIGVVRIQEATALPIIPLAMNTGIFYRKHSWCKKPGRVIFEFLPPIPPDGKASDILRSIEMQVEEKTSRLMEEGVKTIPRKKSPIKRLVITLIFLSALYSGYWAFAAYLTQQHIIKTMNDMRNDPQLAGSELTVPSITGFPKKLQLHFPAQKIISAQGTITVESMVVQSWPVLGVPVDITTGKITAHTHKWAQAMTFDTLTANLTYANGILTIHNSRIQSDKTALEVSGTYLDNTYPYPVINFDLAITDFAPFLQSITKKKIVKQKASMFASMALKAMEKDGKVQTSIKSDRANVYLGPLKIFKLQKREQPLLTTAQK
ncbi:MAG: 1-acyl-sn-glycerol-3-phosphate acyltransferase [Alphaproteobacteria bacterium]